MIGRGAGLKTQNEARKKTRRPRAILMIFNFHEAPGSSFESISRCETFF